jgi:hypothetical protein
MKTSLLLLVFSLLARSILVADDTPVPPEVQKLAESMLTAFKASDDAALKACWHSPEVTAKVKAAEATKEGEDPAKEEEKEIKKQTRNLDVTAARAEQTRALISKRFGELSQLSLTVVELNVDEGAPPERPRYDNVRICVRTADGTQLELEIDDAVQIDGVWKFQGRIDDAITVKLPDVD